MSTAPDGIQVKKVLTETGTGPTRIIRAWETFIFSVSYLVLLGLSREHFPKVRHSLQTVENAGGQKVPV